MDVTRHSRLFTAVAFFMIFFYSQNVEKIYLVLPAPRLQNDAIKFETATSKIQMTFEPRKLLGVRRARVQLMERQFEE